METLNNTAAGKPQNLPRNMTQHNDAAGTNPDRYSKKAGKVFNKEINKNSGIMSNKKVILGVAAGVAALAVTAVILKRKGYLDGIGEKAEEFGSRIKDKYASLKETATQKFDEVVTKGGEIADKIKSKAEAKIDAETV